MAVRKRSANMLQLIERGLTGTWNSIVSTIANRMVEAGNNLMDSIEIKVLDLKTRLVRNAVYLALFALGSIFILVSLVYFLLEYTGLGRTETFFVVGVFMLLLGWLVKIYDTTTHKHMTVSQSGQRYRRALRQ